MELEEVVALGRGVRDEDQAAAIDRTQACVEAAAPTVKAQRLQIPVTGSQGHVEVGGYGSRRSRARRCGARSSGDGA
jgi:hypothetical protein